MMSALFDPIAELYERYADINDEVYRPYLERSLPGIGKRAIDLGCGSGRFTGLLADRCASVVAVDIAKREIEIARAKRSRPNVEYRAADLLEVGPAKDGLFDVVLSVNTLFHLFRQHDADRVLSHVRSLVAPGGTAVIVDIVPPARIRCCIIAGGDSRTRLGLWQDDDPSPTPGWSCAFASTRSGCSTPGPTVRSPAPISTSAIPPPSSEPTSPMTSTPSCARSSGTKIQ
jgi:SAM-dependent methyltransferase